MAWKVVIAEMSRSAQSEKSEREFERPRRSEGGDGLAHERAFLGVGTRRSATRGRVLNSSEARVEVEGAAARVLAAPPGSNPRPPGGGGPPFRVLTGEDRTKPRTVIVAPFDLVGVMATPGNARIDLGEVVVGEVGNSPPYGPSMSGRLAFSLSGGGARLRKR